MATTQYIGARYVPMFYTAPDNSNNWTANVAYDPLTIVSDLSQSYTSKKPVPASVGRPSENPDYWILTGNYNAQVNTLINRVEDVETQIDAKENNLDAKYFLFIGDSLMAPAGSFVETAMQYLGHTRYYKTAVSGYGFRTSPGFSDLLTAAASAVTPADVTDIIVLGGSNDTTAIAQLPGLISAFVGQARTLFPNADIHIGVDGWTLTASALYGNVVKAYNSAALAAGAHVIDGMYMCQHGDMWVDNTYHPNTAGTVELAKCLVSYLKGNIVLPNVSQEVAEWSLVSGISSVLTPNIITAMTDKSVSMYKMQTYTSFNFEEEQRPAGGWMRYELGRISNAFFHGDQYGNSETPTLITTVGQAGRADIPAIIGISQSVLYVKFDTQSTDRFYQIRVGAFNMTMPYFAS